MQLKKDYINDNPGAVRTREITDGRIRTWSGMMIDPTNPDPTQIRIDDIAHALSLICRYGGHINAHYSVADHSLNVLDRVRAVGIKDPAILMMALLHDAEEAYLGDMPSPIKRRYFDYRMHGDRLRNVIFELYVPYWNGQWKLAQDVIEQADGDVYVMERLSFFQPWFKAVVDMEEKFQRPPITRRIPSEFCESSFLYEFNMLTKELERADTVPF